MRNLLECQNFLRKYSSRTDLRPVRDEYFLKKNGDLVERVGSTKWEEEQQQEEQQEKE